MYARLRAQARNLAYSALYYGGSIARARARNGRSAKILTYHSVAPHESPFTGGLDVRVTPSTFARQIDYLCRNYSVVSLSELVQQLEEGCLAERVIVLTFDDGFADNYQYALPVLLEHRISATIFLVGDALVSGKPLWMHRLAYLVNILGAEQVLKAAESALKERLPDSSPKVAVRNLRHQLTCHFDRMSRDFLLDEMYSDLGVSTNSYLEHPRIYLSPSEVSEMIAHGITFGSHGATHTALSVMSEPEQAEEIRQAWQVIAPVVRENHLPFAYPFGEPRHYTSTSQRLAIDAGHQWLLAAGGGYVYPQSRPIALGRIKVEEESVPAFAARIEGIWLRSGLGGLRGGAPAQPA